MASAETTPINRSTQEDHVEASSNVNINVDEQQLLSERKNGDQTLLESSQYPSMDKMKLVSLRNKILDVSTTIETLMANTEHQPPTSSDSHQYKGAHAGKFGINRLEEIKRGIEEELAESRRELICAAHKSPSACRGNDGCTWQKHRCVPTGGMSATMEPHQVTK